MVTVGGCGQQVHLGAVGGDRAAHRLPVDCDREQWPVDLLDRFGVGPVSGVARSAGGGRPAAAVTCRACSASQEPIAASTAAASTPVRTRHRVVFDGPPGVRAGVRGGVEYSKASSSVGTSAIQPAIALNERIPASTAAAHNVNTAETG